jgi:hypothetical protein
MTPAMGNDPTEVTMRTGTTARLLVLTLALLVFAAPGCIFSPENGDDPPPSAPDNIIFASTVQKLMQNFVTAYTERNASAYRDMLDTRFQFYYTDGTSHDYTTEVTIIENMFSGAAPSSPPPGSTASGIRSIQFDTLDEVEIWKDIPASHPDFGGIPQAQIGYYNVKVVFHVDDGTITVTSQQYFYAVPVSVNVGGQMKTEWKLLGQEDIP